jgi:SAM-dependent methyltransferase
VIGRTGRYGPLIARHPELFDARRRVLEVGSGAESIARYLGRPVVGVDRAFPDPLNPHLSAVRASIPRLPFRDGAFDDVVCSDSLLHLAPDEYPRAIAELVRVASKGVIIAIPAGSFAASVDAAYAQRLARAGARVPDRLRAPLERRIPQLGDLFVALLAAGYAFTVHRSEGVLQHYAGLLVDRAAFLGRFLRAHDLKFPGEAPLRPAEGDLPYSYLFAIDKTAAPAPGRGDIRTLALPTPPSRAELRPPRFAMFAVGHRVDRLPAFPGMRRILAGVDSPATSDTEVLRDDIGPNIADRNHAYSEMTAIYWVWRNVRDLDAVGFCHYRRYFDFRPHAARPQRETYLRAPAEVQACQAHFADRSIIEQHLAEGAIIVARPMQLDACNPEQYMLGHVPEHYLAMVNHVLAHHPDYGGQLLAQARDRSLCGSNMFVMPWPEFDRLCRFWFDCLFGIEKVLETKRTGYQGRALAFLSERIFDLHVRRLRDSGQKFVEYPIICLHDSAFSAGA